MSPLLLPRFAVLMIIIILPYVFHCGLVSFQAPWTLTFWLVYEEIRVLANVGNF